MNEQETAMLRGPFGEPPPPDLRAPRPWDAALSSIPAPSDAGVLARWAELPHPARVQALIVAQAAIGLAWVAWGGARADLHGPALLRFAILSLPAALIAVWASLSAIRPAWRRSPGGTSAAAALLLPSALAILPWPGLHLPHAAPMDVHLGCGWMGFAYGALATVPALVLQRSRPADPRAALIAVAGGAAAFVVQNLLCPLADTDHLLLAHASAPLLLAAALLVGVRSRAETIRL